MLSLDKSKSEEFNWPYNFVSWIIGINLTVEYGVKFAYENTVGRLTQSIAGSDTESDRFIANPGTTTPRRCIRRPGTTTPTLPICRASGGKPNAQTAVARPKKRRRNIFMRDQMRREKVRAASSKSKICRQNRYV